MDDTPHYYAHTHVRYTHNGQEAALAGNCGQLVNECSADERTQFLLSLLESAKQASAACYLGSTTEISGNCYEGYIVRDTWTGSCGHENVSEARLFLNQEPCDPRKVQAEQNLLAFLDQS